MTTAPKHMLRGGGRVAFLARKDEIRQRIDAGYPLFAIFKEHESEMNISYSQFTRYVAKFIRSGPTENKLAKPEPKGKGKEKELSPAELLQLPNDEKDAF